MTRVTIIDWHPEGRPKITPSCHLMKQRFAGVGE